MGKPTGFLAFHREPPKKREIEERLKDSQELYLGWDTKDAEQQGARCMNCAVPFCHTGCPLGNLIPEWNHLIYVGQWKEALQRLHATNNFPEFTGRICPAPCEPEHRKPRSLRGDDISLGLLPLQPRFSCRTHLAEDPCLAWHRGCVCGLA